MPLAARQLWLLAPSEPRQPPLRARRDWKPDEFVRALARNGFQMVAGGTCFADITGTIRGRLDGVFVGNPKRLARRATLARLIRQRGP